MDGEGREAIYCTTSMPPNKSSKTLKKELPMIRASLVDGSRLSAHRVASQLRVRLLPRHWQRHRIMSLSSQDSLQRHEVRARFRRQLPRGVVIPASNRRRAGVTAHCWPLSCRGCAAALPVQRAVTSAFAPQAAWSTVRPPAPFWPQSPAPCRLWRQSVSQDSPFLPTFTFPPLPTGNGLCWWRRPWRRPSW